MINYTDLRLEMEKIKKKLNNQGGNIEVLFRYFDELIDKKQNARKPIGFKIPKKKRVKS